MKLLFASTGLRPPSSESCGLNVEPLFLRVLDQRLHHHLASDANQAVARDFADFRDWGAGVMIRHRPLFVLMMRVHTGITVSFDSRSKCRLRRLGVLEKIRRGQLVEIVHYLSSCIRSALQAISSDWQRCEFHSWSGKVRILPATTSPSSNTAPILQSTNAVSATSSSKVVATGQLGSQASGQPWRFALRGQALAKAAEAAWAAQRSGGDLATGPDLASLSLSQSGRACYQFLLDLLPFLLPFC